MYLGLLYPVEDYRVYCFCAQSLCCSRLRRYGYCTNTMTKLVVVADFNSGENDMKEVKCSAVDYLPEISNIDISAIPCLLCWCYPESFLFGWLLTHFTDF